MPIILVGTYSKKLGLPNFSSHSFSVSLSTEIADIGQAEGEASKLYSLLQQSVDRELSDVGYLPDATVYGMNGPANGNGRQLSPAKPANGSAYPQRRIRPSNGNAEAHGESGWACSDKQRDLILRIIRENKLDVEKVEATAQQLFGVRITACNKMQASQLIEELLEQTNSKRSGHRQWREERKQAA